MKIQNTNELYGDPVEFNGVDEMVAAIMACGYILPEDGLKEGRDYCIADSELRKNAAAILGRKGGSVKSDKKAKTSAENGKKGGRPRKYTDK